MPVNDWEKCRFCINKSFKRAEDFTFHLRDSHCTREGGSYVCHYGRNQVCTSLPLEGVSDTDYAAHVMRDHVSISFPRDHKSIPFNVDPFSPTDFVKSDDETSVTSQPSVVTDQKKWGVLNATVNLASLLNDPTRHRSQHFFTQDWGPEFVPQSIQDRSIDINLSLIRNYQRHASERLSTHIKQAEHCPVSQPAPSVERSRLLRQREQLAKVGNVFYKTSFDLSSCELFNLVYPDDLLSSISSKHIESKMETAQNQHQAELIQKFSITQEKLTQQLDAVEIELSQQISSRTSFLFTALTSHDTLRSDIARTAAAVKATRSKMSESAELCVIPFCNVISAIRKRERLRSVARMLHLISAASRAQPGVQSLLSCGDYLGALELIVCACEVLTETPKLSQLRCLAFLPSQLSELRCLISRLVRAELTTSLRSDENDEKVRSLVVAADSLGEAWAEDYISECKFTFTALIKHELATVASELDVDVDVEIKSLASRVPCHKWQQLIEEITQKLNIELKKSIDRLRFVRNTSESDTLSEGALCKSAQDQAAKLLSAKLELWSQLGPKEYRQLEGSMELPLFGGTMRTTWSRGVQRFLNKWHSERRGELILLLESERWRRVDSVAPEFQAIANTLLPSNNVENQSNSFLYAAGEGYASVNTTLLLIKILGEYARLSGPFTAASLAVHTRDLLCAFNARCSELLLGGVALQVVGMKVISSRCLALCARTLQLVTVIIPPLRSIFDDAPSMQSSWDNLVWDYKKHLNNVLEKLIMIAVSCLVQSLTSWDLKPPQPSCAFQQMVSHMVRFHGAIYGSLDDSSTKYVLSNVTSRLGEQIAEILKRRDVKQDCSNPLYNLVSTELIFYDGKVCQLPLTTKLSDTIWRK